MYNLFKSVSSRSIIEALPSHESFAARDTQLHQLVDNYFTKDFTSDSASTTTTSINHSNSYVRSNSGSGSGFSFDPSLDFTPKTTSVASKDSDVESEESEESDKENEAENANVELEKMDLDSTMSSKWYYLNFRYFHVLNGIKDVYEGRFGIIFEATRRFGVEWQKRSAHLPRIVFCKVPVRRME